MSHINKLQPIRVKMIRIAALRVKFCLLLLSNGINVGIGHTCNTMSVYHDTIIKCATLDSFCLLFPYPPQPAFPHMRLRNVYDGQRLRCDVTKSALRLARFQGHTKKASGKTYTGQKWKEFSTHRCLIECPRRNVPNFGRVFLMLKYTDITQNTYIQS
jgi:hypothetical protein